MAHWLLVWGVAVVCPLTLRLHRSPPWLGRLQALTAFCMIGGWCTPALFPLASCLWLLTTLAMARAGWQQPWSVGSVGLLYSPIGGVWAVAASTRGTLLGFDASMTLLTAVHFCYVSLGAMQWTHQLQQRQAHQRGLALLARAQQVTPALVAAGISLSLVVGRVTWLEVAAVSLQVAATGGACLVGLRSGPPTVAISALLGLLPLLLALNYAWGRLLGLVHLELAWMIPYHGLVNALGFVTLGLMAWVRVEPSSSPPSS